MNTEKLSVRDVIALSYMREIVSREAWGGDLRITAREMWQFADIALEERKNVYKKKGA